MNYGEYTPYIAWSYGIAAVGLIGVTVWTILRVIGAKKKLDAIEPPSSQEKTP